MSMIPEVGPFNPLIPTGSHALALFGARWRKSDIVQKMVEPVHPIVSCAIAVSLVVFPRRNSKEGKQPRLIRTQTEEIMKQDDSSNKDDNVDSESEDEEEHLSNILDFEQADLRIIDVSSGLILDVCGAIKKWLASREATLEVAGRKQTVQRSVQRSIQSQYRGPPRRRRSKVGPEPEVRSSNQSKEGTVVHPEGSPETSLPKSQCFSV